MRHQLGHRQLSRSMSHRRALLRNLVTALVLREQVKTTLPKAKELRPLIEKFVTLARKDTLHNRRQAYAYIFDKAAVQKLFSVIAPRFMNRNGGYTRIVRADSRKGDAAAMAIIEFVEKSPKKVSTTDTETETTAKVEGKKATAKKASAKAAASKEAKPATKKTTKKATSKKTDKKD